MTLRDLKKEIQFKILAAFVAICPIFFYFGKNFGNQNLRIGQEQFFQLGATVLFAVVFVRNIWLALFLIWSVFLYSYYNFPPVGGNIVMNLFWACVLYCVAYKVLNKLNVDKFFDVLMWLGILNIFWITMQVSGYDPIFLQTGGVMNNRVVGLFGLKAFMGMYFAMTMPIVAKRNIFLAPLWLIPVALSESSAAFIGALVAILWVLYFRSKKSFIIALLMSLILGVGYIVHDSKAGMFNDRINIWKVAFKDSMIHPIIGNGLDSFRNVSTLKPFMYFKNVRTQESASFRLHEETKSLVPPKGFVEPGDTVDPWDHPHNEFVSLFYEFGIFGIILLVGLVNHVRKRFWEDDDLIAICGFFIVLLVISVGHFPFHVARIGVFVPIMLGVFDRMTAQPD